MTVKQLYEILEKEIENGHANIPVMIREYCPDANYWLSTDTTELDSTIYHEKRTHWPEHLELRRCK